MDKITAAAVLSKLQEAQNEFYGGGDANALREVLAEDVVWTVPGRNAISGTYRGIDQVLDYFSRRRDIADATFRLHRRDVLVGEGQRFAALTDGTATVDGREQSWSTVGVYELQGHRVSACWLLPLDAAEFDSIWS